MPGVIDCECENDRGIEAGIIADSWRWQNIRLQLNETMATTAPRRSPQFSTAPSDQEQI